MPRPVLTPAPPPPLELTDDQVRSLVVACQELAQAGQGSAINPFARPGALHRRLAAGALLHRAWLELTETQQVVLAVWAEPMPGHRRSPKATEIARYLDALPATATPAQQVAAAVLSRGGPAVVPQAVGGALAAARRRWARSSAVRALLGQDTP